MDIEAGCDDPEAFAGCVVVGAPGTANIDPQLLPFLVVGCWLLHCPETDGGDGERT